MKWDGTSSDETKKQLYSIIERFMLKYPDPDSKLLDKELRGAWHTKEECYLNMRYILGDRPGRSDGSYSKEDKKFVEYLSKKLSNEINIAKTTKETSATDNESRSDVGKKSSGENKKRLLESLPEENREEAEYYWGLGRAGEDMKKVYDEPFAGGTLSDLERVQAWSAGKNDRKLYLDEVERESTYGLSDSDETRVNLNDIDKTTARFLDAAAKKLGVTVEIRGILGNSAGNRVGGFTEGGSGNVTFTMNAAHKKLKGKALAMYFATHEFVHSVRIKSREAYNKLVNAIGTEILTDKRIAAKIAEYAESNIEIDTETAKEEIIAEYVGEALAKADKKTLHKIIGGRRNVAEVLLDLVNKLIDIFRKDKELREGYKEAREAIIEAMESIDRERAQRIKEGRTESTQSTENVKYATRESSETHKAYDYSKSFSEQIDDFKSGLIPKNDTLILSGTPKIYTDIGLNALPITIDQTHIRYALNNTKDADHYLGEAALKALPQSFSKPVAVIKSNTVPKRIVGIYNIKVNGKQMIAAIEIDGYGLQNKKRIDSNAITSFYGKGSALKGLEAAISSEANGSIAMFYWNKKEAVSLLQRAGLQLPGCLPQDGFIHSIREKGANVNTKFKNVTETQQFKRWFGDPQNNPKKASKIVNEDGTPKVVYHGTSEKFTVFDRTKSRSNMDIQVMFFSPWEIDAKGYGENVGAYYLNIKNPAPEGVAYKALRMFEGQNNA